MSIFPSVQNIPFVPRVGLMRALSDWQRMRVISMVAPAGFGKSTTAMLWLQEVLAIEGPQYAAWVALNATSDVPEQFVEQVGAQLAPFLLGVREVLHLGSAGELTYEQVWAAMLTEIRRCDRWMIIVIDDMHLIESDAVLALIQLMVDEGPEKLRLMLLSRSGLRLQFSRMQLAGTMLNLGMEDLAFGHGEFLEFVRMRWHVDGVAPEMLDEIEARVRGWPAGLQLIGQALPATRSVSMGDLKAMSSMTHLWEYVESEILRRMPARMQELLVQSSLLPFLSVGLCGTMLEWSTDEAQQILEAAARTNGLITSYRSQAPSGAAHGGDVFRDVQSMSASRASDLHVSRRAPDDSEQLPQIMYRVHPVLQEYLQRRLLSTVSKVQIGMQRRRAAEWLATYHDVDLALSLLLHPRNHAEDATEERAADVMCAADIVERMCGVALRQIELTSIERWAAQLPNEVFAARPRLALDVAWAGRLMARRNMRALIDRAAHALAATPSSIQVQMRAEMLVLEAYCCFLEDRMLASDDALQEAFTLDPDPHGLTCAYAHLLNGFLNSGVKRTLDERIRSFRKAASIFEKLGFMRGCIEARKYEALARRRVGDVAGAIVVGEVLISYAETHDWMRSDVMIEDMLYHGETLYYSGAVRPALECLMRAASMLEGVASRTAALYQLQLRIQLCRLALGDVVELDRVGDHLAWEHLVAAKGTFVTGNCAYVRILRDLRMGHAERSGGTLEAMSLSLADVTATQLPNVVRPILAAEVFSDSRDRRLEPMLRGFLNQLQQNEIRFTELQVHMLLVLHLQNAGREDEAAAELEGVLALLERTPCVQMVIDFPQVRPLLVRIDSVPARRMLRAMQTRKEAMPGRPFGLSATEVRVLKLLARGYETPHIAEEMYVSVTTVRSHIRNVYTKLAVHRRADALRVAKESGVI
jgi:ATP/maltotriose-dependent transcriptional regulator MalT